MKGLFMLTIVLLLLNTSGITQIDTVRIPLPTSVKIIQDLGRLDEARVRIVLLEENIKTYQEVIDAHKAIINNMKNTAKADREILVNTQALSTMYQNDLKIMTRKYKGQVRKARFMFVLSIGAVGFGLYQTFLK
jgi:hypothetical protein